MKRTAKAARTKAGRIRAEHGLSAAEPIADLLELVERRVGVPVAIYPSLGEGLAGAYLPRERGPVILLNGADSPQRMRFTLAHELGHHVFGDSRREDTHAGLARPGHWIEVRANAFAAELLMPVDAIEVPRGEAALDDLRALATTFGVSLIAACIRLEGCGADVASVRRRLDRDRALMYEECAFDDSLGAARRRLPRLPSVAGPVAPAEE